MSSILPQSLNVNVQGLRPSATVASHERCRLIELGGGKVFKLGMGQSPFPIPGSVVEALREHAHQKDYLPTRGLSALRAAVAAYHRRRADVDRTAEDVLIGPGSKELQIKTPASSFCAGIVDTCSKRSNVSAIG